MTPAALQTLAIAALAYLIGSVSFAVVVSKAMGLPDPHSYGSGNPGATNVLRSGSKKAALLTLLGDTLKGVVAVLLAVLYTGQPAARSIDAPIAGAMALLGHVYPVFHGFKGGKGVATAAGVLLAINVWLGAGVLATFAIVVAFFRIVSLASVAAAVFALFWAWFLFGLAPVTPAVGAIALLVISRHRDNIVRLLNGTESRLGAKKA